MIHITCTQKMIGEGEGSKRSTIPNAKTVERIHNLIKNGADWDKIYQDIFTNNTLLKKKIKNKKTKQIWNNGTKSRIDWLQMKV